MTQKAVCDHDIDLAEGWVRSRHRSRRRLGEITT